MQEDTGVDDDDEEEIINYGEEEEDEIDEKPMAGLKRKREDGDLGAAADYGEEE